AQQFIIGGEACFAYQVHDYAQVFTNAVFTNEYGPSEATIGCMAKRFSAQDMLALPAQVALPIGHAIDGCRIFLLDECLQITPLGARGQIYIAGEVLTLGYVEK